jgi:hypothetical protein
MREIVCLCRIDTTYFRTGRLTPFQEIGAPFLLGSYAPREIAVVVSPIAGEVRRSLGEKGMRGGLGKARCDKGTMTAYHPAAEAGHTFSPGQPLVKP